MIHHTPEGQPKRRIAVIQVPRPQRARMGSIGSGYPASGGRAIAWTTISDATPDSSDNWMSLKLREQARARETTPGSLSYTPASDTPAPNVAPWNSWANPNCGLLPQQQAPTRRAAAPAAPEPTEGKESKLWLIVGLLGAAASATYLFNAATGRR